MKTAAFILPHSVEQSRAATIDAAFPHPGGVLPRLAGQPPPGDPRLFLAAPVRRGAYPIAEHAPKQPALVRRASWEPAAEYYFTSAAPVAWPCNFTSTFCSRLS